MVGLKERCKAYDFVVEGELPDHLAVMLRYLSLCEDNDQVTEIIRDAMMPALERMVKKKADAEEDVPGEAALDGCAPNGGAPCQCGLDEGALDVGAMDVGALDVSAMDVGGMDVSAMDVSGTDVGAMGAGVLEEGALAERPLENSGPEQKVYPELLHALRLVLQELPVKNRQPVMNLSP